MDVVDGKIVSARMGRGDSDRPLRGNGGEWAPSWATTTSWSFSDENVGRALCALGAPCHGPPSTWAALEAGEYQRPAAETHRSNSGARHDFAGLPARLVTELHREGWAGCDDHDHHDDTSSHPWSETKVDQTMAMYESPITLSWAVPATSSPTLHSLPLPLEQSKKCSRERSGSDAGSIPKPATRSDLKRKRPDLDIIISDEADQGPEISGWSHPLKLLVRKGLSVSDVGELGRIIIPKRCAEAKFQQIDTKEGALLEMEDYSRSKRWIFRFKWWINNKSRMYVLENTGQFIKYHGLKQHDIFIVYADSSQKMVVRGHHKGSTDLDSTLNDVLQGTSSPEKSSSAEEEGLSSQRLSYPSS